MSKKNYYIIEKNTHKIRNNIPTNFLNPKTIKQVLSKLKEYDTKIYRTYYESERNIVYVKEKPKVSLIEIISFKKLTHREIMGSVYNLNIDEEMFGDIVITNNHYYVYVIKKYLPFLIHNFKNIGRYSIKIKEVSLDILKDYKRCYERIEIIVSSIRIDSVVSKIIHKNRNFIKEFFVQRNIYVNYESCLKPSYTLKEGDIFSIRGYGKYKFGDIMKSTKKGGYIIECFKYTEN